MSYTADICSPLYFRYVIRWRGVKGMKRDKKKELIGLNAIENRIKNAFIEVSINSSRIKS